MGGLYFSLSQSEGLRLSPKGGGGHPPVKGSIVDDLFLKSAIAWLSQAHALLKRAAAKNDAWAMYVHDVVNGAYCHCIWCLIVFFV